MSQGASTVTPLDTTAIIFSLAPVAVGLCRRILSALIWTQTQHETTRFVSNRSQPPGSTTEVVVCNDRWSASYRVRMPWWPFGDRFQLHIFRTRTIEDGGWKQVYSIAPPTGALPTFRHGDVRPEHTSLSAAKTDAKRLSRLIRLSAKKTIS